ncbi:MAG: recombination protein NinB [Ruminococcus sp.]|nr:recombination protein NinB [Ruminococcus sp.]
MKKTFKGSEFNVVLSELMLLSPDTDKIYELELKEKKKRRSLDANAYCWVLLGKLARVLRIPADELYKEFIRRNNTYFIYPIKSVAVAKYIEVWSNNGIGWFVDDLGENKANTNYHNLKCFYGSSSYDTKEMATLLDEIVYECKENGIETATGAELALLKEE